MCDTTISFFPSILTPHLDFYTKNELPFRLALFWMSSNVCSTIGSFIAFGVLRMRGVGGRPGWRCVQPILHISFITYGLP
jgi:hypothetical protein